MQTMCDTINRGGIIKLCGMRFIRLMRRYYAPASPVHFPLASRLATLCALIFTLIFFALLPRPVLAQQIDLGVAAQYSGFFFNDAGNLHEIDGRLAVGGNLDIGGYNIGGKLTERLQQAVVVVGGNISTSGGGKLQSGSGNGFAVYGGTLSRKGGGNTDFRQVAQSPVDFNAERTNLTILSQQLRDLAPTGTVTAARPAIILNGSNAALEIFNLTPEHITKGLHIELQNISPNAHIVLNIAANRQRQVEIAIVMNAFIGRNQRVLLNFPDTDVLTFQGGLFPANVLAPYACVTSGNGQLDGTVIAASWKANMKLGYAPLTPL